MVSETNTNTSKNSDSSLLTHTSKSSDSSMLAINTYTTKSPDGFKKVLSTASRLDG